MAFLDEIRFSLRTMAKNPGFTLTAVVALALGIGVNATVFAIANGVLFKNMPFVSDRILYLTTRNVLRGETASGLSFPDYRDWRAQAKSFNALGAYDYEQVNVSDTSGLPSTFNASRITANAFTIIGQKPVLGHDFTAADEKAGAPQVAILSDRLWETRYGRNASVLGQTIRIDDVPTTVIGIMRPGFRFPEDSDLWTALVPTADSEKRSSRELMGFGALAPGATRKSAAADLATIARNLARAYPDDKDFAAVVQTFDEESVGPDLITLIAALVGAVGFVLLIACANVANLLLARAVERSREISIRIAIGASRWRIIRQLLTESVMLSITGGFFGWIICIWGVRAFDLSVRDRIPAWMTFSLDYRGFAYLGAISVGTGLLFGLAPALRFSRLDVNRSLKDGARGSSAGGRAKHLSGLLVIAEMSLAVVLLIGAGLLIRSFVNIYATNPGVNVKNVLVMRLSLPAAKYPRNEDQIAFHRRLKARLDALPGVQASDISVTMPTGGSMKFPYELEHAQPVSEKLRPRLSAVVIGPDYFRVMDVHPLRGRVFTENDGVTGPPAALVNQRFAEKFWPGADPIGKRLRIFKGDAPEPWLTVAGVVPNILQNDVSIREFDPLIYIPYRQRPLRDMSLMARTIVPPGTLAAAFRREVQAIDENMPVYNLRTLEERLAINHWKQGIFASLFGIFAVIALALASVGLYAIIAHSVSARTQEIGVRMALGASEGNILRLIFLHGMRQLAIGLAAGLLVSAGVTRVLVSELANISPTDPVTFATVAFVLALAAALGCWIPARRATRVDPVVALRCD